MNPTKWPLAQNYVILNALRRKDEQRVAATTQESSAAPAAAPSGAQIVPAAADWAPEAEVPPPQPAMMQQVDGTVSSMPSRGSSSPQAYDEYDNNNYSEGIQDRGVRRPPMRPVGKVDKPLAWKGSSVERWQEYTVSLQAWHAANRNFMTEAQAIHKVFQTFRDTRQPAAADSLTSYLLLGNSYLLLGNNLPSFSDILYDIDNLFKVNRVSNALVIVNELNLKSSSATEAVAKIEKLSKLER